MTSKKLPSLLGGSMIIAGTAIGAGMLANPTSMSGIWFVGSLVMFLFTWFYTVVAGLMLMEVNLHFPKGANLNTMVTQLLGKGWNIANGLAVAFTLYILTYAYITSGGGITENLLHRIVPELGISHRESSLLFCFALALFVSISTKAVSRLSTILIAGMIIAFFLSTTSLLSSVRPSVLLDTTAQKESSYILYLLSALPMCLVSFGYHVCLPSLVSYYNKKSRLVIQSILIGTGIAFLIYILWQMAVQGNLPREQFAPVIAKGGDVAALLAALSTYIPTQTIGIVLDFFAYMAIASSFLGVTLGLFDYITDLLQWGNSLWGRIKTALVTFLPPLMMSLFYPYGFVTAITYAGVAVSFSSIMISALMVRSSRKKFPEATTYRTFGGTPLIYFIIIIGILNIVIQIGIQTGIIPIFTGNK